MHILVVNDDGPPSNKASPYILTLVRSLQAAGHTVSVILPHVQRSWIGKAHFVGQLITPTYYRPSTSVSDIEAGTTHDFPLPESSDAEEWILIDGTPATCTQLGLHHFFKDREPVDLVISGPNYGRNSTSLFALSSGTLGGALEAAAFKKRAIALSYAFFSQDRDQNVLEAASKLSVKIVEYLATNWGDDVEVYSINVPLIAGVETNKVFFTEMLENYWSEGSTFEEVKVECETADKAEQNEDSKRKTREQSSETSTDNPDRIDDGPKHARHIHRHFKWAPRFADVHRSVEMSKPGNDGWAIRQGYTSITPLRASFTAARSHRYGEVNLNKLSELQPKDAVLSPLVNLQFYAYIDYEDQYVTPLIKAALKAIVRSGSYLIIDTPPGEVYLSNQTRYIQISQYETLPHEELLNNPTIHFGNAYAIRKALIRKHYLSHTIASWTAKNPNASLRNHVPLTLDFELDYAEFLDDALIDAWEFKQASEKNESLERKDREWWILKPSMSDKGQGIRLFSSQEELQEIFDEWEETSVDEDEDEDHSEDARSTTISEADPDIHQTNDESEGFMTSQLRHFVMQPYIPPLLIPSLYNRKFHVRSYVLAIGALKIYVYEDMLALFSAHPYSDPGISDPNTNLSVHLTNTVLQTNHNQSSDQKLVYPLSALPPTQTTYPSTIWTPFSALQQILPLTAQLFTAASAQPTSFQPLPNCFEVFGLDWLVDEKGKAWLLEVNAFPDFQQTGAELAERVVGGFWRGVVNVVITEWFGREIVVGSEGDERKDSGEIDGAEYVGRGMWKVLDLDMGRR